MTDICDRLNVYDATYEVRDDSVRVSCGVLRDAANVIRELRAELAEMKGYFGAIPKRSGPAFKALKQ